MCVILFQDMNQGAEESVESTGDSDYESDFYESENEMDQDEVNKKLLHVD